MGDKEAYLYEELDGNNVKCKLCAHECTISSSKRGICGVRENRDGVLYTLVYGKAIAHHVDPIEKKPLYHFFPGSISFSIATVGCNFVCDFCQNYYISQMPKEKGVIDGYQLSPQEIVDSARVNKCVSISYTYTEPTIFFEYAYDTAVLAKEAGLKNVFVTNGFMSSDALKKIHPYLDAANVDLKSFSDNFYRMYTGGRLHPVLDSIALMKELGIWVEVTTLVIPTRNDSFEELRKIAKFIVSVGSDIPWHISRFHPLYKASNLPPTSPSVISKAREIGFEAGLKYVYTGNLPGDAGENTYCYNCGEVLIQRFGFQVSENNIEKGHCKFCNVVVDGVGL